MSGGKNFHQLIRRHVQRIEEKNVLPQTGIGLVPKLLGSKFSVDFKIVLMPRSTVDSVRLGRSTLLGSVV